MSLYALTAWEDNGYHDSYFYSSYYNTETDSLEFHETGSTAHAGGFTGPAGATIISDLAILERAIAKLAEHIFTAIRSAEYKDVLEPEPANCLHGRELRLLRNCRHKGVVIPAGTVGEVVRHESFGSFYRNGYNRPDRTNTRVTLRMIDGSYQTVALSALRQHRETMSDADLRTKADELARNCGFSAVSGIKHAWDSENYAADLLARSVRTEVAA